MSNKLLSESTPRSFFRLNRETLFQVSSTSSTVISAAVVVSSGLLSPRFKPMVSMDHELGALNK